jgi:hypothetical protein
MPNLVQSLEGVPAFVHGGPFANIAHGCNSVLATRMALARADYAVTEAGFAFDLGGEKFFDLKCRSAGLNPAAVVIVVTIRALKMHGGLAQAALGTADAGAVERGLENLAAHLDSAAHFGKPVVVAINRFAADTADELNVVHDFCASRNVASATADVFGGGGAGATALVEKLVAAAAVETPLSPALSARLADRAEDRTDRPRDVWSGRGEFPSRGRGPVQEGQDARLRAAPCLHGQDPGFALGQPQAARPPPLHPHRPRRRDRCRRRVRGCPDR